MCDAGRFLFAIVLCCLGGGAVYADELSFQGYLDTRLIVPPDEESWLKGGLGKLRFGSEGGGVTGRFVEAVGEAEWNVTSELSTVAVLRVEPEQRMGVDALETYARYRPAVAGAWQWSVKAGAFFPPISLENDDVGWTSPYTLTPSAIDSWIGDELRTIGGEGRLEWRNGAGVFAITGAIFCCNDPAGVLMAYRGWSLDDRPTGLFEKPHEPNATLALLGLSFPDRTPIFQEIDHRPGWYGGASWELPDFVSAQLLYYDNAANPSAHIEDYYAWRTKFWSAGLRTRLWKIAILAQALEGSTEIAVQPPGGWTTNFWSSYALASYDFGDWRLSARADFFGTGQNNALFLPLGEHGHALTTALIWTPKDWLRLTAEYIALDAQRLERLEVGLSKAERNGQFQLSARFSL